MKYFLTVLLLCNSLAGAELPKALDLRIRKNHPTALFDPRTAMGAGLDGHWQGETDEIFTPRNIKRMLGAGLGPVSVRLRTELAVEAWHWNPKGRWSDPKHGEGYWTSDATPGAPIHHSYGYKLPRRGTTLDEANDDGYSMLDDGDSETFWKSNPYLTSRYTGEVDSAHPQWAVLDFGKAVPINSVRIRWAEPYAKKFEVEYARTGRAYFGGHPWNVWKHFPCGTMTNGIGGDQTIRLTRQPVMARYLRLWMTEGSGTSAAGSDDPRDRMGYAIREISAGISDEKGVIHDQVSHSPDHAQTLTYASSTDPWHRAIDRDPHVEQPGIDLIARCGLTRGLPLMLCIPVFYDTPENAVALARYTRNRGIAVGRYELGEEPDGQRVAPEDFGALYAQVSRGMRACLPDRACLGGPSFVTVDVDKNDDTYRFDHRWWIEDFRRELAKQKQGHNFQFLSFEWYPFDDVEGSEEKQLPRAYGMLERAMKRLRPLGLPLVVGESNYSVFPCQQEIDLGGALLNAEMTAQFLTGGGDAFYYYSYEPNKLEASSGSWGNQMMLMRNSMKGAAIPLASFHALRLMTQKWMNPEGGPHQAYAVSSNKSGILRKNLSLFALKRPDLTWSILVINKDTTHSWRLSPLKKQLGGRCRFTTYSAKEYLWKADGMDGHPLRNTTPKESVVFGDGEITIPPWSLTVVTSEKSN
ncbi:MAG: discoidin domain-containing protein [bacterium]